MSKATAHDAASLPTHGEIVDLVGDLDETVIAAIRATQASAVEIEEAVKRITGDAELLDKAGRPMTPRVSAVFDILMTDPAYSPESER